MPSRRLISLFAALLMVVGISALPVASAAEDPSPGAELAFESCHPSDDEMTDEELGLDDEVTYFDETDFRRRTIDEPGDFGGEASAFDEEDELFPVSDDVDSTGDDALGAEELADEALADEPCFEELEAGVEFIDIDDFDLNFDQLLTQGQTFNLPDAATIDQTLSTAKGRKLGAGYREVTEAGAVNGRIRLNAKGRKHRRSVRRVVRLTLDTTVELASFETVTHRQVLRVKPSKQAKKPKKTKPGKKPAKG